jgi:tRNA-dihydrouridine synthase
MPIVDLAPRLEDVGVAALTVHCRTAVVGHSGPADWSWAKLAASRVKIPVVVNGDIRGATEARAALEQTGCAGVMVGRRAIDHPWVFREIRSLLDDGVELPPPTPHERLAICGAHLEANVAARGEHFGVRVTRRHLTGYLKGLPGAGVLRKHLLMCDSLAGCLDILAAARDSLRQSAPASTPPAPPPPAPVSQMQSP